MDRYRRIAAGGWVVVALNLGAVIITGCAAGVSTSGGVPVGAVEINQAMTIEHGYARVTLQDGQVVARNARDKFGIWCDVETRQVAQNDGPEIVVNPGVFAVTRIRRDPVPLGISPAILQDAPGPFDLTVYFHLQSSEQPNVLSLNCTRYNADVQFARHPNLAEMVHELGGLVTLQLQ